MQLPISNSDAPIGVFDSGIGGLSVLRHIRAALPREHLLYVADSGHAPYGVKSAEEIVQRCDAIAAFLLEQGAKALVVACNTATAAAIGALRARHAVPIVGMEPAVKPAVAATRSGVVGVLATDGTLASARFAALLERYSGGVRMLMQRCPGLVEGVERGATDDVDLAALVRRYVEPLIEQGADTLVLGCTHFPLIAPLIAQAAGPQVTVLDTGAAVARELVRRLEVGNLQCALERAGRETFWTSGAPETVRAVIERVWNRGVEVHTLAQGPAADARATGA